MCAHSAFHELIYLESAIPSASCRTGISTYSEQVLMFSCPTSKDSSHRVFTKPLAAWSLISSLVLNYLSSWPHPCLEPYGPSHPSHPHSSFLRSPSRLRTHPHTHWPIELTGPWRRKTNKQKTCLLERRREREARKEVAKKH